MMPRTTRSRMSLRLPGVHLDPFQVHSATLTQDVNSHDVLRVGVNSGPSYSELSEGAPAVFTWEGTRGRGLFHGYVHRVDPQIRTGNQNSSIICVGTTRPLMAADTRVWAGVRASDVVREVASLHRLASDVEDHPRVYEQISQAGDSYWQLLVRLSEETGWVLRADGATIRFRSRGSMTSGQRPHAPTFRFNRDTREPGGDILSFVPQMGAYTPETGARLSGSLEAVDPSSGSRIATSGSVLGLRSSSISLHGPTTAAVVRSAIEAESAAVAARENSRFSLRAHMESVGDPEIRPEGFVNVLGVPQEMAGSWVVRKVTHEITRSSYTCSTVLGTDGLGPMQLLPGEAGTKIGEVNPHRPGALPAALSPILVDNRSQIGSGRGTYWTAPAVNWRN